MVNMWHKCTTYCASYQLTCASFIPVVSLFLAINKKDFFLLANIMDIGIRIIQLRKAQGWSQDELAGKISSSRAMIGKYERGDNLPSIEVLVKLAQAFEVSVDYLVGEGVLSSYDKEILKRINQIEQLDQETREKLFFLIDNVIQNYNAKKAFS